MNDKTLIHSRKTDFRVFAHRGASQLAPENTIPALQMAKDHGATWVECDLQLTQGGDIVIFHDDTLDRTTNGSGYLSETPYAQVDLLDAGSWFGPRFAKTRVPLLAVWLQVAASLSLALNLELKVHSNAQAKQMALLLVQQLKQYWPPTLPLLISSSDLDVLLQVDQVSQGALALALISDDQISKRQMEALYAQGFFSVHHQADCLTKSYVERLHEFGFQVYAYTVNDPQAVKRLKEECGIDGVFTDVAGMFGW